MKTLLLRLEGPLQSWGTQGRFGVRDTDREPSKSGVLGLVGAALGMPRDDEATLATLRRLRFAVRVDHEGTPLRDYQTAGGGGLGLWDRELGRRVDSTALTERYYLQDASFLVGLGSDDLGLLDRVAAAVENPVWPLSLGRRNCPPSARLFVGCVDGDPRDVLARWAPPERRKTTPERLRIIYETDAASGAPRQDDPERFTLYGRSHTVRYVATQFVARADLRALPEELP